MGGAPELQGMKEIAPSPPDLALRPIWLFAKSRTHPAKAAKFYSDNNDH